jgi:hypothetical protein
MGPPRVRPGDYATLLSPFDFFSQFFPSRCRKQKGLRNAAPRLLVTTTGSQSIRWDKWIGPESLSEAP